MANPTTIYFAFISYNSKDIVWGKRLQRKLEHYRMPATLCNAKGWRRTPIRPIFFAPTDIQPGGLTKEIQERLKASRNLIVICSPNSAQSDWVGREIAFFHSLGRAKDIHFFIIDGIPHSNNPDTECFNPIVNQLRLSEILGANINEKIFGLRWLNRERAYVQLISKLLNVEFDSIWKRHRRILVQRVFAWIMGLLLMVLSIIGVCVNTKPVDVQVQLNETSVANSQLPQLKDAVITLELDNEVKVGTIESINQLYVFKNIPHRFLNKQARIKLEVDDYFNVDTFAVIKSKMLIDVCRDSSVYGNVKFRIWDQYRGKYMVGEIVNIAGYEVSSDADGQFQLYVPLKFQKSAYHVESNLILECDTLYMPCGENDVRLMK